MQINVNGESTTFEDTPLTVLNLLKSAEVASPDMVSVQINGKIIDRSLYGDTLLKDQDEVNFLYFMGGGA